MAVHDTGAGRKQGRFTFQIRLHGARLRTREQRQVGYTVGQPGSTNTSQLSILIRRRRHDQFAAALVADRAFFAIGVQQILAAHAQLRLERSLRVINAGMDNLAIARTGTGTDCASRLQHQHLAPPQRKLTCHGQTHHAGANHDTVQLVHKRRPQASVFVPAEPVIHLSWTVPETVTITVVLPASNGTEASVLATVAPIAIMRGRGTKPWSLALTDTSRRV